MGHSYNWFNCGCLHYGHLYLVNWISPFLTVEDPVFYTNSKFPYLNLIWRNMFLFCALQWNAEMETVFYRFPWPQIKWTSTSDQINFVCCCQTSHLNLCRYLEDPSLLYSSLFLILVILRMRVSANIRAIPPPIQSWWEDTSGDYKNAA